MKSRRFAVKAPSSGDWCESAPGGLPTLFVYDGRETCFFPGEGGI
jgi:hypothetical protein